MKDREMTALSIRKKKIYPQDNKKAPRGESGSGSPLIVRYTLIPMAAVKTTIDGKSSRPVNASARNALIIRAWHEIWKYRFIVSSA